ncbi:MAG TPA: hypothetical protein VMV93_07660, partial [Chloroflexota bacterium]|nr:hypothetical protein [Chloroflexota bacterium]
LMVAVVGLGGVLSLWRLEQLASRYFPSGSQLNETSVEVNVARQKPALLPLLLALPVAWAWGWLCFSVANYGTVIAQNQFSEGIAWTLTFLSFAVLMAATSRNATGLTLLSGLFLALAVLMRTTVLPLAALGLALIWTCSRAQRTMRILPLARYLAPMLLALMAVWAHAGFPLSPPAGVLTYWQDNTGLGKSLVPGFAEALILTLVAFATLAALVSAPPGVRRRSIVLPLVVLGEFLPELPQLAAPYYPRQLMMFYYVLAIIPIFLMVSDGYNSGGKTAGSQGRDCYARRQSDLLRPPDDADVG